jgi:hypothetical protein
VLRSNNPQQDHAVQRRGAPSTRIDEEIAALLAGGLGDAERLAEVGRLGAQLIIQREGAAEEPVDLGRARYERAAGARGSRNGVRPRRIQTAEGEVTIQVPQPACQCDPDEKVLCTI